MKRAVVLDALSGREIIAGEEEQEATQPLVFHLVQRLGWSPKQIISRPQWRVPASPSGARKDGFPVDLAIFDSPEHVGHPDHVRILVECKAPNEKKGVGQLKTYLGLEPEARMGIWFNGRSHVIVWKLRDGFAVSDIAPMPRPSDPLTPTTGKRPRRYEDLMPPPHLGRVFSRLRDDIAAQDSHVNRDEFILNDLANLLICKIVDEQAGEASPERTLAFQSAATREATASAIRRFFDDTRNKLRSVFVDESDMLHVDDASLEKIVEALAPYRLLGNDRHAVGDAFQVLRGRALKGNEGAYFTPPPVVDCIVSITDPTYEDRVIDPACGTGGFLAAGLDHVFESVDKRKITANAKDRAKQRWAGEMLFAIDKDAVSVKLCKAYLTLLGDGRSHVYRANTIDRSEWPGREELQRELAKTLFDVVMTNPPFGQNLTVSPDVGGQEGLAVCRKWKKLDGGSWEAGTDLTDQQLGIAFFERTLAMLRSGGRLAIVLPETFLFSPRFAWFVDWIIRTMTVTHVVDVPMVAFEEFCRAKTVALFITKSAPMAAHRIMMSYPRTLGLDHNQQPLYLRDEHGKSTGELDNEMAEAVRRITALSYNGDTESRGEPRRAEETRLRFSVRQVDLLTRPVLVPRYWWRKDSDAGLKAWSNAHTAKLITLGELQHEGSLEVFAGHGSPPSNARRTGTVPYVKVTDLKNWRINENPTNFVSEAIANHLRGDHVLRYCDLVSPARASSNIGQFSLVLPWQTQILLTKEVLILRVISNERGIDAFLLLALLSLRVVQAQYEALTLMQTNREHLGDRWKEVSIPVPESHTDRKAVAQPVREYFEAVVKGRESWARLTEIVPAEDFGTRP